MGKSYFLFIFILLSLVFSECQKHHGNTDSSKNWQDKATLDSIKKLDSLVNLTKTIDIKQAKIYGRAALSIAKHSNSGEDSCSALLLMGSIYINSKIDSSYWYYSEALKIASHSNLNKIKPKIYYSLAMVYYSASDLKTAALFLDSSIMSAKDIHDYASLSNAYNALGNLQFNASDASIAKIMFDSSFTIAKKHNLNRQMGVAIASLSRLENDNKICSALRKKALGFLQETSGNEEEIASILINLGSRESNPDSAIKYYLTSLKLSQKGHFIDEEIGAYNDLAYSYLDKHDYHKAGICLSDSAIPLAMSTEKYEWLSTLYDTYSDVLTAGKQPIIALNYEHKAMKIRTIADKKKASEQIRLISVILDLKGKEVKIQTDAKVIQDKNYKIQLILLSSSVTILLIAFGFLIYIWRLQKRRIKDQDFIIESGKKLIYLEENMKGRVSMDLHDLITPFYTSIKSRIDEADIKDPIKKQMEEDLSRVTGRIRRISHQMNIGFIEERTIKDLVQNLCMDLNFGSSVRIDCEIAGKEFHLSDEQKLHIYRIIQELMTNANKYVTSGEVSISISEEEGMFYIFYQDTGPGFTEDLQHKSGLGLMNIRERVKIIKGKAHLDSEPGTGTSWKIIIPLDQDNHKKTP